MQLRTLVIVPNLELKRQLTTNFKQYFGDNKNIRIENIDSKALAKATDYDCLIIDESHHAAAKTYRTLNKKAWSGIYHRFCFTATPYRSREEENILFESVAGQVIYQVTYETAVSKGYIVPMEAYFIEIPKTKPKGNIKSWPAMYSELVVNNERRNTIIHEFLLKLHANNLSSLCLVKEIKHGENLGVFGDWFFANGVNEDTPHLIDLFSKGRLKTLVSTTGIVGEGVDTRAAEYIIIAGLGKSKPAFMQQCGRGFRNFPGKESCKIILIKDNSHKWCRDHFKKQCQYLAEEYSIVPIQIFLD